MNINEQLTSEFGLRADYTENIINLIDEGNTIPFIARYRKEMHGSCDDQVLRNFADRLKYLRNLEDEKTKVEKVITEQGKWTDEIAKALSEAMTLTEVEDIYRPYKPKRKTRASVAIAKGLEGLADILQAQSKQYVVLSEAEKYITEEVKTVEEAIAGAKDIIAERISDSAELRKELREIIATKSFIQCALLENENSATYETYANFKQEVKTLPSHRILAINRGENEKCLKVSIVIDEKLTIPVIERYFKKDNADTNVLMDETIADAYERLLFPSLERECRNNLTDVANEQAIKMFEVNLRPLLLESPLKNNIILGFDPGYHNGCKIAVIDKNGSVLDTTVVYPTPPRSKTEEAMEKLKAMIEKNKVDIIAIGNGTASKESEIFVAELIKHVNHPVSYAVVSEAGASVYS
ncbi:MAG: RNA-binding transcriptional accessory protein, partial [Clostridia bacterium]|nr:RNA-binding transcriptional accessory protein [Clostridia bacterium]